MFSRSTRRVATAKGLRGGAGAACEMDRLEPRSLLAAVFWDGGGDNYLWHDALNWSGEYVPNQFDDVTIDTGGVQSVTIAHGYQSSARTLELGHALTVAGILDVVEGMHVGDVELRIEGTLRSAGVTIEAGTAEVVNSGRWTISGESSIHRPITNSFDLTFADRSETLLGEGLTPQTPGSITSTYGIVIGEASRVTGIGGEANQLSIPSGRVTTIGALALLSNLNIATRDELGLGQGRLQFPTGIGAMLIDCTLDLERTRMAGRFDGLNVGITVHGLNYLEGRARLQDSTVTLRGALLIQGNDPALELFESTLTTALPTGQFTTPPQIQGTIVATDSELVVGATPLRITGNVDLIRSAIAGVGQATLYGTLRLDGSTIGPSVIVDAISADLELRGNGTNRVQGSLRLFAGEDNDAELRWASGGLLLDGPSSSLGVSGERGTFVPLVYNGAIGGTGTVHLYDGAAMEVTQTTRLLCGFNNEGVVRVTGGSLDLQGPVAQVVTTSAETRPESPWAFNRETTARLFSGEWEVKSATLLFNQRIDWNSATITLHNSGKVPDLGDRAFAGAQLHNDGQIILLGNGSSGLTGTAYSTRLSNTGELRAEDVGLWRLLGDIHNYGEGDILVDGRLIVRGKQVTNRGTIVIDATRNDSRFSVEGTFSQHAGAILNMKTGNSGPVLYTPEIKATKLELGGRFKLEMPTWAAQSPATFKVLAGQGEKARVGTFGQVKLQTQPRDTNFFYTPTGFRFVAKA